jgi:hypothetical protein
MPPKLHFAYAATPPSLEPFDVKTIHPADVAGRPGAFAVIGESHYVGVPALDFHEVCSCEPLSGERVRTVALESGVERTFSFESERLDARTRAVVRPLDAFPGAEHADAAHRFGPDAWTTVRIRDDDAYETYHTYPEYDLALYTETRLAPRPAISGVERPDESARTASDDSITKTPTHD